MSSAIQLLGAALIALSCVCSELTPALIGTASNSQFVNGTFQATASDEPPTQLLVSASQLLAALQSSNVSISAYSISVDAPIDVDSVHSLSLYARTASITISAALRTAGPLTLASGGGTEIAAPTTASSISVSTDLHRTSPDTARGFTLSAPLRASKAGVRIILSEAVRVESSIVAATKIRLEVMGGRPVGLGNGSQQLQLTGAALRQMSAVTLEVRAAGIFVDGVTAAQSAAINGVVSLVASGFGSRVVFDSEPSVFRALAAQADGGIEVNQNVRTSQGKLELGRVQQLSDQKSSALAVIEAGVALVAHNGLVIGAVSADEAGDWVTVGGATRLQSQAAAGIMLGASIKAAGLGGPLTIDAGEGTLTIAKGRHVDSNGHPVVLSSLDLDLLGTLNAGRASVTVSGARATQAISIGGDKAPQIRVVKRSANMYSSSAIPIQMHLSDTVLLLLRCCC